MRKTQINKMENDWVDIKNKCRTTVSKEPTENEPSSKFINDLLISEHSPVRLFKINFKWRDIPSWVATHFSRHKWECFVSTRRSDRIGKDRNVLLQGEPVLFEGEMNAQHLIDTSRKRLCYQASPETRELMEDLKISIKESGEKEMAFVMCPNCVYRGGCPEFKECGFWDKMKKEAEENQIDLTNIYQRYSLYNDLFDKRMNKDSIE